MSFEQKLAFGQDGEGVIMAWLLSRGNNAVLPIYKKEGIEKKGPRIFLPGGALIAPDLFVINGRHFSWVEAKHKTGFTWHKNTLRWTTGIDLRHYRDYCRLPEISGRPVWLLFLQRGGATKGSPEPTTESGLFGQSLVRLRAQENHRWENDRGFGLVYWARDTLIKFAELSELGVASVAEGPPSFSQVIVPHGLGGAA